MTISEAIQLALQHHEAGRLAEAETLCRQILAVQPNHAGAIELLGVIFHQSGRDDLAMEQLRRAIALQPKSASAHSNFGEACRTSSRVDEAIAAFRRAIELRPEFPDAHNNLGVALASQVRMDEAIACYRRAIAFRPLFAEAHNNLGIALASQRFWDEAITAYRHAIQIKPGYAEPWYNLGIALKSQGRRDDAIASYRRALEIKPDYAEAHFNLGLALRESGQAAAAIAAYRRALEIRPAWAEAHNNLGQALTEMQRPSEAVPELSRAVELKSEYGDAWYNLGIALHGIGRLDDAAAAYHRALAIDPCGANVWNNLGNVLKDQGDLLAAVAAYRKAGDLRPENASLHSNLLLGLLFLPNQDNGVVDAERERWNRRFSDPLKPLSTRPANDPDPDRRLRIGYVSPDFRDHVVGRNLLPLFRHHDGAQFEIVCYAEVPRADAMTGKFRQFAQQWRDTLGLPDEAVATMIREDGIDLLVDLAQHTGGNRLPVFAHQAAPVQLSFAGYPESSGVDAIPFRLSDRWLEGETQMQDGTAARSHPETCNLHPASRIFLLDSFWCYDPCGAEIEVNALPAGERDGVTFGCLNSFGKVNGPLLDRWAEILNEVAGSRLVLLCAEGSPRQRTWQYLEQNGIAPQRVEFVLPRPRRPYLELYHQLDVMLDTFPYNGHTTSLDALWMGVPVVSLMGQPAVSRGGLSILSNIGLPELVASAADEYVRLAVALARDPNRLAQLRASLRGRMENSVLTDAAHFTRQIELAYRAMWRQWCAQTPPLR